MMPESEIRVDTPMERNTGNESLFSIAAAYFIFSSLHDVNRRIRVNGKSMTIVNRKCNGDFCIIEL